MGCNKRRQQALSLLAIWLPLRLYYNSPDPRTSYLGHFNRPLHIKRPKPMISTGSLFQSSSYPFLYPHRIHD